MRPECKLSWCESTVVYNVSFLYVTLEILAVLVKATSSSTFRRVCLATINMGIHHILCSWICQNQYIYAILIQLLKHAHFEVTSASEGWKHFINSELFT
jgi:hypothetical protein